MIPILFILIAVISYGLGALNGATLLSRFVFHKDLRQYGSGNVGYTNFVRVFGSKWAPAVVAADILKSAIAVLAGGLLMLIVDKNGAYVPVGKLFACLCLVLGDMYPIQYQFRGGKGVICCLTAFWLVGWPVGLVATGVFVIVVAFSQYVSLAGMCACAAGAISVFLVIPAEKLSRLCGCLALVIALFIVWRHRGNIFRILEHREPRVKWGRPQPSRRSRDDRF